MKTRVLFLCADNSCLSQLAEAVTNARFGEEWQAFSAATRRSGQVHANTFRVLQEIGIEHLGRAKSVAELEGKQFDVVITLSEAADREVPVDLRTVSRLRVWFPDPAEATGTDKEVLQAFRTVRDYLQWSVSGLLLMESHRIRQGVKW